MAVNGRQGKQLQAMAGMAGRQAKVGNDMQGHARACKGRQCQARAGKGMLVQARAGKVGRAGKGRQGQARAGTGKLGQAPAGKAGQAGPQGAPRSEIIALYF